MERVPPRWLNRRGHTVVCSTMTTVHRAATTGDRDVPVTFEGLYRREIVAIAALATVLTGSREIGADLAQEAMLRAYRDWTRVGMMDRPGAWVRRVVINLAQDSRRRRVREDRALGRCMLAVVAPPSEPSSARLWAAVRVLPARQRAAVALFYIDDLGIDQIAHILEIAPGTAKATLHAARKSLARALDVAEEPAC